jgi:hypothetical protein
MGYLFPLKVLKYLLKGLAIRNLYFLFSEVSQFPIKMA